MELVIRRLITPEELETFIPVIRNSFKTVADQLGLTESNSPTNPAFTTSEKMNDLYEKAECFGLYFKNLPCGFFAIEFTNASSTAFLERVCVIPEQRHNGFGKQILDYSSDYCRSINKSVLSIGIINSNTILKNWYIDNGFSVISLKKYPHLTFDVCFLEKDLNLLPKKPPF